METPGSEWDLKIGDLNKIYKLTSKKMSKLFIIIKADKRAAWTFTT